MAYRKTPPRGYRMQEYPLPHEFLYNFDLGFDVAGKNSTICTLIKATKASTGVEGVEVNPRHGSFTEEASPTIHQDSIVPRLSINISARISEPARNQATFPLKEMIFKYAPIYTAFKDDLTAEDEKTGTKIESIIGLQKDAVTNLDAYPLFDGNDLLASDDHPLSNVNDANEAFGDYALTGSATLENVVFNEGTYYDCRNYYTNGAKLAKVMPKINTVLLRSERPWHMYSNNFTNPTVKRGNPFTFCGILFFVPIAGAYGQVRDVGDVTNIEHIVIQMKVRFDEWNHSFDQTPI